MPACIIRLLKYPILDTKQNGSNACAAQIILP
jgi:hypothetical protein